VDNGQNLSCPNGLGTPGCALTYIGTFPSNVHSPNGYASNPNAVVTFGPDNLPLTGRVDLTAFPADWPSTYDFHYTLGAEYDLGHQWVASVGYQGSQTRHLTTHYNLYNPASANGIMLNPRVTGVTLYADDGSARFNALLLEAKHSFSRSFLVDTQYRLSHTMDPGSNAYAGPDYQWNLATGFATADYDVRHAFKLYGVWSPTIFSGSHAWVEKIAGGWSISGILNAHSGFPWSPVYGLGEIDNHFEPVFNFGKDSGGGSADAGSNNMLPAAYAGGFKSNFRSNAEVTSGGLTGGQGFFTPPTMVPGTLFTCLFPNPSAADCPSGQQGFGPLPTPPGIARNSFRGPSYFDVDATLSKSFGLPSMKVLGEGAKLEIRANFYNLFNKLNLTNPQTDIMNSHFGEVQAALGARTIEMQARFNF